MNVYLYVACYAGLIAIYGVFAFFGKVPVDGFIGIITAALAALGAVHIAAAPPAPTAPPKDAP